MITANQLKSALLTKGLVVLTVTAHPEQPERMTVFLSGNAGQGPDGDAVITIRSVPEVVHATVSQAGKSIINVTVTK